jgi:hypothetical protein
MKPLLVAEDISSRRELVRAFGVTWSATRYAWLCPLSWIALGLAIAFSNRINTETSSTLIAGFEYAAVLYTANILHSLGHIFAGYMTGSPVEIIVITSTRDVTIYKQPGNTATLHCRLVRSIGGPAANLMVGCVFILLSQFIHASLINMVGIINMGIAIWTLTPIPTIDGSVIWSILIHSKNDNTA